jgi:hypothetical protein
LANHPPRQRSLTKAFRIDELTEQLTPGRGLITIVGADQAECGMRLKEIEAAGGLAGRVRFIMTGVKRAGR